MSGSQKLNLFLLCLVLMACSCGTRSGSIESKYSTFDQKAITGTPEEFPSKAQLSAWYDGSTETLFKRWLAGEDLKDKFVDLDWPDEAKKWLSIGEGRAKVALFDVDGDGREEMGYQTACAAAGNCDFYIYKREGKGHRQILAASMVQRFKLRPERSNGFFDLETSAHDSANSGGIAVYKYDGKIYKISECFGYEYKEQGRNVDGTSVLSKEPTLMPAKCDAWPGEPERWF